MKVKCEEQAVTITELQKEVCTLSYNLWRKKKENLNLKLKIYEPNTLGKISQIVRLPDTQIIIEFPNTQQQHSKVTKKAMILERLHFKVCKGIHPKSPR